MREVMEDTPVPIQVYKLNHKAIGCGEEVGTVKAIAEIAVGTVAGIGAGAVVGGLAGAAVGSALPGPGTVAGLVGGAAGGEIVGGIAGAIGTGGMLSRHNDEVRACKLKTPQP